MMGIDIGLKELLSSFIKKGYEAVINSNYFQNKSIEKNYTEVELGFLYEHFFERNYEYFTQKFQSCDDFVDSLPSPIGNDLNAVNELVEHNERLLELEKLKYQLINKFLKMRLLKRMSDPGTEELEKNSIGKEFFDSFYVTYQIDAEHCDFSKLHKYFESKSYHDFPKYKYRYYLKPKFFGV